MDICVGNSIAKSYMVNKPLSDIGKERQCEKRLWRNKDRRNISRPTRAFRQQQSDVKLVE